MAGKRIEEHIPVRLSDFEIDGQGVPVGVPVSLLNGQDIRLAMTIQPKNQRRIIIRELITSSSVEGSGETTQAVISDVNYTWNPDVPMEAEGGLASEARFSAVGFPEQTNFQWTNGNGGFVQLDVENNRLSWGDEHDETHVLSDNLSAGKENEQPL